MAVTEIFVRTICIELDMLTWLVTNPFSSSVLILVIADTRDTFKYQLNFYLFYCFYLIYLFLGYNILYTFKVER